MIGLRFMVGAGSVISPRIINGSFENGYVIQDTYIFAPNGWVVTYGRDAIRGARSSIGAYSPPSDGSTSWQLSTFHPGSGTAPTYGWVKLSQLIDFTGTSSLVFNVTYVTGLCIFRIGSNIEHAISETQSLRTIVRDTSSLSGHHLLEIVAGLESTAPGYDVRTLFEFDYFRLLDTNGEVLP